MKLNSDKLFADFHMAWCYEELLLAFPRIFFFRRFLSHIFIASKQYNMELLITERCEIKNNFPRNDLAGMADE